MDSALFGFIGVIAGSMTTGAVQYATEWRIRRTDSLAASRLIYGALVDVELAVKAYVEAGIFAPDTSFGRQLDLWEAHRVAVARKIDVYEFQIVQAACSHVRNFEDVLQLARQEADNDNGARRIGRDPYYDERIKTLNEAQLIALEAGSRWNDRRKRQEHVDRLVNRPTSPPAGIRPAPRRPHMPSSSRGA